MKLISEGKKTIRNQNIKNYMYLEMLTFWFHKRLNTTISNKRSTYRLQTWRSIAVFIVVSGSAACRVWEESCSTCCFSIRGHMITVKSVPVGKLWNQCPVWVRTAGSLSSFKIKFTVRISSDNFQPFLTYDAKDKSSWWTSHDALCTFPLLSFTLHAFIYHSIPQSLCFFLCLLPPPWCALVFILFFLPTITEACITGAENL